MSEYIRAHITRAGVGNPIVSNVMIQIDKMNAAEATSFAGSDPHFTYTAYTLLIPVINPELILFRDYVVDQVVIDPITKTNRKFLIISDPEPNTMTGSWRWVCVRQRGN